MKQDTSLLDQYLWLTTRLIEAFGVNNVRPDLSNGGNTLLYSFGPINTPGFVLAEKRISPPVEFDESDEYTILEATAGWSAPHLDAEEYSLNAESDRVQAIEEMIQLSVAKIDEISRSRNGAATNQGGK
jgi:hypothetical protein